MIQTHERLFIQRMDYNCLMITILFEDQEFGMTSLALINSDHMLRSNFTHIS